MRVAIKSCLNKWTKTTQSLFFMEFSGELNISGRYLFFLFPYLASHLDTPSRQKLWNKRGFWCVKHAFSVINFELKENGQLLWRAQHERKFKNADGEVVPETPSQTIPCTTIYFYYNLFRELKISHKWRLIFITASILQFKDTTQINENGIKYNSSSRLLLLNKKQMYEWLFQKL